jgi:ABC-type transport system involved in multi-copper enzyme maturation permease subunit
VCLVYRVDIRIFDHESKIDPSHMRLIPDAPLLQKELAEQSQQLRTYIIRGLFGLLLYVGGILLIYGRGGNLQANVSLGQGRELFWNLVYLEALAIYLFLPAMMAGSLAGEKERASLPLLLLTTLPPWSILIQKLLSRLIPAITLIILSFPLLGAAYSFGGVPRDELLLAGMMLVIWAIQLSAISLACSSFSGTTVSALMGSYLITAGLFLFCSMVSWKQGRIPWSYLPFVRSEIGFLLNSSPQGVFRCVILTGVCLLVARLSLFSRAFTTPVNFVLKTFRALDQFWHELNAVTGGVVLVDDKNQFPAEQPVAWRETAKKSLGTFRYLFRVLVLIETPILVTCQSASAMGNSFAPISYLYYVTWGIGGALLVVHASSVIAGERSRQTLDPLLTTPLTGARIVKEKLAGVRRLIIVLLVPMCTVFAYQHWFRDYGQDITYVVRSGVLSLTLLLFLTWMCCWIGMRNRSQLRAIVASMLTLIVILGLPIVISYLITNVYRWNSTVGQQISLISPLTLIQTVESQTESFGLWGRFGSMSANWQDEVWYWGPVGLWFSAALLLRWRCLSNADGSLGRVRVGERYAAEPSGVHMATGTV